MSLLQKRLKRHFIEKYGLFYALVISYWCTLTMLQYPAMPSLPVALVPAFSLFLIFVVVRENLSLSDFKSFVVSLSICIILLMLIVLLGQQNAIPMPLLPVRLDRS